jgi:hypothetical protein
MIAAVITIAVLAMFSCAALGLYLLPVLIGSARRAPDLAAVAVINILLGWTIGFWIWALVLALRSPPPAAAVVQVYPPPTGSGPGWYGPPPLTLPPPGASWQPPPE